MDPPVLAPGVAQVNVNYTYGAIPIQNTIYFLGAPGITQGALDDLTAGVYVVWEENFQANLSDELTLRQIEGIALEVADGISSDFTAGLPTNGTADLVLMPSNNTIAISFRTGRRGRSRRGRNYWPLLGKSQVVANEVQAVTVLAMKLCYVALIGLNTVANGWTWGVYSRVENGEPRLVGLFTPITDVVVVDATVDSQRGRLR